MADAKYHVIKLTKNHLYPTYQLYATMANKKTSPQDGLLIGALTVMQWLKERLQEDSPKELLQPAPEAYKSCDNGNLPSIHIDSGYVVDIVSMPDEGIWSLLITEPDLGSDPGREDQERPPVPGRVIETHIGFRISGQRLECGFKTVISDPAGVTEDAEVYRLAVVRRLMKDPNFGLYQISTLPLDPVEVTTVDQMKSLLEVNRDKTNQLPNVVFTYHREKVADPANQRMGEMELPPMETMGADLKFPQKPMGLPPRISLGKETPISAQVFKGELKDEINGAEKIYAAMKQQLKAKAGSDPVVNEFLYNPQMTPGEYASLVSSMPKVSTELEYDCKTFAIKGSGFCRTYIIEDGLLERFIGQAKVDAKPGDIILLYPARFKVPAQVFPYQDGQGEREKTIEELAGLVTSFPKRREVNYGGVVFLSSARELLIQSTDSVIEASRRREESHEADIAQVEAIWAEKLAAKERDFQILKDQLTRQREYAGRLEEEKSDLLHDMAEQKAEYEVKLHEEDEYIEYLKRRIDHPKEHSQINAWVKKYFPDRILLHAKAIALLEDRSAQDVDIDLICDAIDYLATDYWEQRYRRLTKEMALVRCSKKYGRPFEIKPTSDTTVEAYPVDYKIKYFMGQKGKPVESGLDSHLRVGNAPENLLRIYFLHDDEKKLIVIGSLPRHLKTLTIK